MRVIQTIRGTASGSVSDVQYYAGEDLPKAVSALVTAAVDPDELYFEVVEVRLEKTVPVSEDADRCWTAKRLDQKWGTHPDSPLHHDNSCTLCN